MDELFPLILIGMEPEQIEGIQRAKREGTIFNWPDLAPVIDCEGDPLIKGQVYIKPNGDRFRVTDWRFGSGNFMDTYYWVFGIDNNLRDDRITVDVQHRGCGVSGYPSGLQKAFQLEEIDEEIRREILRRRTV